MAKQKSRFPSYGLVRGPSHEHGGVAGMVADEQPVELEGGEWIIPKEVVPDYLPVLKQITNEGRAMQRMDTGNTAMDALIASASMDTGLSQPKSPMYQEGGQVKPSIMDYLNLLKSNYEKYQGDVMTESGAPMFGPEGSRTKAGYAEKYNFPLEEAKFDTLYDSASLEGYTVTLPGNRVLNLAKQKLGGTDKSAEMTSKAREIENQMKKDYERAYTNLGLKVEGDASRAIDAVKAGYLDMDSFGRMGYDIGESGVDKKRVREDSAKASAEKQMMMKALGMNEKEYDDFQAMKARLGKRNYNTGGPVYNYQEGGQVGFEEIADLAKLYGRKQGIVLNPEDYTPEGGRSKAYYGTQLGQPEGLTIDTLRYANPADWSFRFKDPEGQLIGTSKSTGMLPILTDIRKEQIKSAETPSIDNMSEYFKKQKEDMGIRDMFRQLIQSAAMEYPKEKQKQQGGPIKQYQDGGQMQPRKQQEIRNPQVYGPPVPTSIDSVLKQLMMRDVNQSINPFTGDTINTMLDSMQLKQQMDKSKMPRTGRKKMRQGGPVMYANGGQLGAGQRLERTYGEQDLQQVSGESPGGYFPLAGQTEPDALLGTIRSDRRIKPLQPDKYTYRPSLPTHFDESRLSHPFHQEEVEEIPKLSTAYLASFGMETPLSKRQQASLFRKGIAPQTLNPQVKGLINRALVQRLTNEDD